MDRHLHKFLCVRWNCGYVLSSLHERSRKAILTLDPLLLLVSVIWITSLQTHSQKLRTADVYLLFESQGKKIHHHRPFFPPRRPNKLKLVDFSSLIDACFFYWPFLAGQENNPNTVSILARSSSKSIKNILPN